MCFLLTLEIVEPEEELLPACSNSSRESTYHDFQGEN